MPIPDPQAEAVRTLCAELHAGPATGAVPSDAAALERGLVRALAAHRAGRIGPAAFWTLIAEADGAIDDARRARAQAR